MKYFIIAGEASGDLHASNLMRELKAVDAEAQFVFLGGDLMLEQGGVIVRHIRDMAFMGIVPVIMNLRTIMGNMRACKDAIVETKPDVLILVDYPSFNLKIAEFVKKNLPNTPVHYYISPKLWAWKSYRLKSIKKYVDKVHSILPFEVEWFGKRGYEVDYVGNPSVDSVEAMAHKGESKEDFKKRNGLDGRPIIAMLSGSRKQEVSSCLPRMLEAVDGWSEYQIVVAGVGSLDKEIYDNALGGREVKIVYGETYELLQACEAAVVCSGTATLEAMLVGAPEVVVYYMWGGKPLHWLLDKIIHGTWISLVNIIGRREMVKELVMDDFTPEKVRRELKKILSHEGREEIFKCYAEVMAKLGGAGASKRAAEHIYEAIREK